MKNVPTKFKPAAPCLEEAPLISVITVVRNGAATIESTIQSFLGQDRSGCEYIVVDGASTDDTPQVVAAYRDKIDHCLSEPDKGVYDAMNKGLALARGRWVYFLNCGDQLASADVLRRAATLLQTAKAAIVVGSALVDGEDLLPTRFPQRPIAATSARSLFQSHFCHQALFVKREAYLNQGGFDLSYPTFADFDMCWKIISAEGEFESADLDIARFDRNGLSSDYRNSLNLYRESEEIFAKTTERSSIPRYWIGAARAVAYKYKRLLFERST